MNRIASTAYAIFASLCSTMACAQVPEYYPPEYAGKIEASKAEPGLTVYSNIGLFNWDPILAAFNKKYPWIKVAPTDMGASEVFERYYADTGSRIKTADLLLTAAPLGWLELANKNMIEAYESPELKHLPGWSVPKPGLYTVSTDPFVIAYNKLVLPKELWPHSMQDLADLVTKNPGKYDRMLGTYAPNASAFTQAIYWALTKRKGEKAFEWFNALGKASDVYRTGGPIVEKITSGEYVIAYMLSSQTVLGLVKDPNREKLIGWSLATDGTVVNMRNVAIMKSAASPNSARLLLDFMVSKDGQTAAGTGGLVSYRDDVTDPAAMPGGLTYNKILEKVGADNIALVTIDPKMPDDLKAIAGRLDAAFGK